jgi:hypothetical protein
VYLISMSTYVGMNVLSQKCILDIDEYLYCVFDIDEYLVEKYEF